MTEKPSLLATSGLQTDMDIGTALALFNVAGQMTSTMDIDFLLEQIGRTAEQLLDSEASSIMLVTDDGTSLYFKIASGEKAQAIKTMTLPIGQGIAGSVAQNRKPLVITDAQSDDRVSRKFDEASGFKTRSILCVPMLYRGDLVGVVEVLNKRSGAYTPQDTTLLSGLASFVSVVITNTKIITEQKNFFSRIMELLIGFIEASQPGFEGHPARSARLACSLGRALGVSDYDYRMLYYAGILHDLGYVALKNSEVVSDFRGGQALEGMHPEISARMLEGIKILEGAVPIIRHHHERWDGAGYPSRLKGAEIPLGARILGLVESVEELKIGGLDGDTVYQKARQLVQDGAGSRFDPQVAASFLDLLSKGERIW